MVKILNRYLSTTKYLRLLLVLIATSSCGAEKPSETTTPTATTSGTTANTSSTNGAAPSTTLSTRPASSDTGPSDTGPSDTGPSSHSESRTSEPSTRDHGNDDSSADDNDPRTGHSDDGNTESAATSDTVPTEAASTASSTETESSGAPNQTGPCEYPEPPSSVSAWVEESWNSQLGDNIGNRSAWLLDNVMMGAGQMNVCVRWGATSAPSTAVKNGMAPAIQRWMNDWFAALGNYGCFPYADGIEVKVTGWAVRPGNEAWVADLGDDVAIYTELDGEGEPKCADACSFFVNWDHEFPDCPRGEAFHTDYWLWVSDQLPGSGAAAVGGDWGLRMPVASFEDRIDNDADLVIEHEIGHGFGFQDYYDWTGSTPDGGSLMIVGSTSMQSPTLGDAWLIRRTWKEMQTLRGW